MNEVVISAAKRTPIGSYLGQFSKLTAPQLAAAVIASITDHSPHLNTEIDECLIGCVLSAAVGQAPARQALLEAGLPERIPCTTINKVCGSGMKTLAMGFDSIRLGHSAVILAGGMESMSNSPYMITGRSARQGMRLGHQQLLDHLFYDGLQNYSDGKLMGCFAEQTAENYDYSRQQQDLFAAESLTRARRASETKQFLAEIVNINNISSDEQVFKSDIEKIPKLKPVFSKEGTVTAANASSISDGAAMCLLLNADKAKSLNLQTLAKVVGHSSHAQAPAEFTTAIPGAVRKILKQLNWTIEEVDLFEINEAFAVVVLNAIETLAIDPARVNINGGACAMGHPIGASGCRIVVSLIHAMRATGAHKGIACICIGGGEAMAMGIEV